MTPIFSATANIDDWDKLQKELEVLWTWSDKWQLGFNASKCKVLHMSNSNPHYNYSMESSNGTVHLEEELEKDLGVLIDPEVKCSNMQRDKQTRLIGYLASSVDPIIILTWKS